MKKDYIVNYRNAHGQDFHNLFHTSKEGIEAYVDQLRLNGSDCIRVFEVKEIEVNP
ncbi:MAG: hypothetical protein GY750_20810 [Lentisphaerae bacterium]|nr:hypothetical protein [Lentisphaerota bacterium]